MNSENISFVDVEKGQKYGLSYLNIKSSEVVEFKTEIKEKGEKEVSVIRDGDNKILKINTKGEVFSLAHSGAMNKIGKDASLYRIVKESFLNS